MNADASGTTRNAAMLEVAGLNKIYSGAGRTVEAIRDVTFAVADGELVCIVGPSGAGKTTLLKCIAGLLPPSGGKVVLDGEPVTGPPPAMAVVFQEYGRSLFPWMTVRQNIELPLKQKRLPAAHRSALVSDALAAVDAQTRADLEDLIRRLWRRLKVTVLFVTHDIEEAVYLGERVLVLSHAPTVIMEDVAIDQPEERSQLETRSLPRFGELRKHVYAQIQLAKQGWRPPGERAR